MALTADQLNVIYQNVLFRNVDSAGIQFFANRSDISDAQVRQQIELSPEASTFVSPIVRLYQEVLGRVPDTQGLKFFSLQLRGGTSLDSIAQSLIGSTEFQAKTTATSGSVDVTDLSNTNQLVSDAFQSILGRTPSSGEFQFFTGKTPAQILSAVAGSSEAANTNAAATVTFLDSVAVGSANGGTLNNQTGAGGSNAGQVFVLTTNPDSIVGTGGNDTINGLVSGGAGVATLTAADTINGGAGTSDILNITTTTAIADVTGGASITNIEGIQVRNTAATGQVAALDASTVPGLTFINSNLSTGDLTVTNAANNTAFGLVGNGVVANGILNAGYAAAATSGIVTIANGTTGTNGINVTGTGLTSLTINSVGATNTVGAIAVTPAVKTVAINATTALNTGGITVGTLAAGGQSLTISGSATDQAATAAAFITPAVVLGALDADFATVNASGLTAGGISATVGSVTQTITGGAGNDIITTNGVLTTGSVNAGNGSFDRLVVANTADLATTALGAKYTGFEQIQAQNGVTVNLDNISGINTVLLNDGAGTTVLNNLSASQASSIVVLASDGASTINVKGATTAGQLDTVGLIFNNGNTTLNEAGTNSTFTLTGVETLNVTAVDGANITESAATAGSLTAVNLSGAGDISFTTGNIATANFNINASAATGNVTVNASAFATNGVTITGGTGTNTLTGSGQNDVINAGTGKNTITGGVGADSITLNTGADKVVYTTSGDSVATTPATTLDTVTNFTAGTDKFIVGTGGTAALPTALVQGAAFTAAGTGTLATDITSALTAGGQNAATLAVGTAAVVTITGTGAGTYLVYNDTTAGYQTTDTVVKLAGLSGTLALTDFATA